MKYFQFVLKILSGNEILSPIKGDDAVSNLRKMTGNNPNLELVNINDYLKFGEILSICFQDIEWKRYSDINQGYHSVTNVQKNTANNPKLNLVNINAYIEFGEILSIFFSRIERKRNSGGNQEP